MNKKLSGYENRKRKQQKLEHLENVKKRMRPIDTFFKSPVTGSDSSAITSKESNVNELLPSPNRTITEDHEREDGEISSAFDGDELQRLPGEPMEQQSELEDPSSWPKHLCHKLIDRLITKGPCQIQLRHYPLNDRGRHFSANYYTKKLKNGENVMRRWLVYSQIADSVFCFCCKIFESTSLSNFITDGYKDWVHLSATIKIHEASTSHKECYRKWVETETRLKTCQTLDKQEQLLLRQEISRWRDVLSRLLQITLYLAENNMAFRGSSDKLYTPNNGKFLGLVQMIAKFDPVMQEHLKLTLTREISDHYCGKQIQNELIHLIAHNITSKILAKVRRAKYYSIIADCTPDNSHVEQLSVTVRIVDIDEAVTIREYFLQFLNVGDTTGLGIAAAITETLDKHGLKITDCRGQGYDNGANMKGKHSGVQKRILELNPLAYFVPCGCHSYNLLLSDAAISSVHSLTLFGVLQRLFTLFSGSTTRWQILMAHVKIHTLKKLSDTRWEARINSVKAIRYQLGDVHDALITLAEKVEKSDPSTAHEALTLSNQLKDFKFIVSLVVWYDILFQVNVVSKSLQTENVNLVQAKELFDKCCQYMENYRKAGFPSALSTSKELAESLNVEPIFEDEKRIRRIKRQFDEKAEDNPIQLPQKKFEVEFFNKLLDTVTFKLKERFIPFNDFVDTWGFLFDLKNLPAAEELSQYCTNLAKKLSVGDDCDIDCKNLRDELISIAGFLPETSTMTPPKILMFIQERSLQDLYPNIWISLRILLTIPVTVASGERSFSKLKLIKTYLRTTMLQERLNDLAIISIENELAETLDIESLIRDFAEKKARKAPFQ